MSDSLLKASAPENAVWRSLGELEQSESINDWLHREFPQGAECWGSDETHRREFLRLMAASLGLAGLGGCSRAPEEKIVPTVQFPEYSPHETLQYATAMPMTGGAQGLLVTSRDGRPLKVEGNPLHPASLGSTDVFAQAAVLDLYDPDRSRVVLNYQQISSWPDFLTAFTARAQDHRDRVGKGLRILSPPILSPTLEWQMQRLLKEWPEARWHHYEPINDDAEYSGAMLAFGEDLRPRYHFTEAAVIVSIDADFLGWGGGKLRYARDLIDRRRKDVNEGSASTNRLYCVESSLSLTGARADHRWPVAPVDVGRFLLVLARKLGLSIGDAQSEEVDGIPLGAWNALTGDLKENPTRSLVVAGQSQPAEVHALVHAINRHLGAVGHTVTYHRPAASTNRDRGTSLSDLVEAMRLGQVESLLILGGNPVFDAPADLDFAGALPGVPWSAHLALYADETSAACTWHVPAAHFLESWSDARGFDGTASLIQPLIAPLHGGQSVHEVVNVLLDAPRQSSYDVVRSYWREHRGKDGFEAFWRKALHDGIVIDTAFPEVEPTLSGDLLMRIAPAFGRENSGNTSGQITTAIFRPHPTLWDGQFANNGWLQELPQPFSTLTWTNAAYVSPADASAQKLQSGDVVELKHGNRSIQVPVSVLRGQGRGVITLQLGGGRHRAGRVGSAVGTNVFPIRTTQSAWSLTNITLKRLETTQRLAATQQHFLMEGRDLVKSGHWNEYRADPTHPAFMGHEAEPHELFSFYPQSSEGAAEQQWGMSINLGACIGCNSCVIACQAENNTPIVGPTQVALGREMHWLRVATYFTGSPDAPRTDHQPVPCMHCEHAPCEVVCPVAATTHSKEGLNEMTYNRCVGTRYCSNNCPYKVRRFNFLDYNSELREEPLLQLLPNPEVTVRSRGVMEKCTYCVQRISAARIHAGLHDRPIADGEVVTACQAVCPTRAITFGDIRDPKSAVSAEKQSGLSYSLLAELNTRPRTTYVASLRNPHPDLAKE